MIKKMGKTFVVALVLIIALAPASAVFAQGQGIRTMGEVTWVDTGNSAFGLSAGGNEYTIYVDANTQFMSTDGSVNGLADLQVGMMVFVMAFDQGDGTLLATNVGYNGSGGPGAPGGPGSPGGPGGPGGEIPTVIKASGQITSVDVAGGSFGLLANTGEEYTFITNEETVFHSLEGSLTGVDGLSVGMSAVVVATEEDGTYLARHVAASELNGADPEELINAEMRMIGAIIEIGTGSFKIQNMAGEQFVIQVNDATIFKSRDGSVNSFADLEVGMLVIVGANSDMVALWVGASKPHAMPGGGEEGGGPEWEFPEVPGWDGGDEPAWQFPEIPGWGGDDGGDNYQNFPGFGANQNGNSGGLSGLFNNLQFDRNRRGFGGCR